MALERSGAALTLPVLLLILIRVLSVTFLLFQIQIGTICFIGMFLGRTLVLLLFFFCFLVMSSHFSLNRQLYHCCVEQATILCKRTGTSPYPSSGIFHLCFCTNLSTTAQRNYTLMCKCRSVSRFRQHLGFFRKEL